MATMVVEYLDWEGMTMILLHYPCTQDSRNFYLLDVYDNCDGDRDVELVDPAPVLQLKRREGKRPAILIGLRDNENDSGVIKVRSIDPSETHD